MIRTSVTKGIGDPDSFHGWAELATGMIANSPPLFNSSLLNQSAPNAIAPVPIARIIDSTDGDIGTLALSPGLNIGIAEYAALISSATTQLTHRISNRRCHRRSKSVSQNLMRQERNLDAMCISDLDLGQQDYPLALASAMRPYVIDPLAIPTENGLDAKVFQGYGAKAFPPRHRLLGGTDRLLLPGTMTGNFVFVGDASFATTSIQFSNLAISDTAGGELVGPGTVTLVLKKAGEPWSDGYIMMLHP